MIGGRGTERAVGGRYFDRLMDIIGRAGQAEDPSSGDEQWEAALVLALIGLDYASGAEQTDVFVLEGRELALGPIADRLLCALLFWAPLVAAEGRGLDGVVGAWPAWPAWLPGAPLAPAPLGLWERDMERGAERCRKIGRADFALLWTRARRLLWAEPRVPGEYAQRTATASTPITEAIYAAVSRLAAWRDIEASLATPRCAEWRAALARVERALAPAAAHGACPKRVCVA